MQLNLLLPQGADIDRYPDPLGNRHRRIDRSPTCVGKLLFGADVERGCLHR